MREYARAGIRNDVSDDGELVTDTRCKFVGEKYAENRRAKISSQNVAKERVCNESVW